MRFGNKSVISDIRPDNEMPYYYDNDGKKVYVDILLNVLGIPNRTTAYPLYEICINFIGRRLQEKMRSFRTQNQREKLFFDLLNDLNEKECKRMREIYDGLSKKEQKEFILAVMDDRYYIHQEPMWETEPIFYRLDRIYKKYDFLLPRKMFIHKFGREIPLMHDLYIGEMYIMKLKQTSRKGFSARGTGPINSKGLPVKSHKNKVFTDSKSDTAVHFGKRIC